METSDWAEFARTRDPDLRDRLITAHLGLVRYLARRTARTLPAHVEADDLFSTGVLGLIDAVDRFDVERGIKFETFATRRITGAILDGLRADDWAPRSVRSAARAVREARQSLEQSLERQPTDAEIAEHLGVEVGVVHAALRDEDSSHRESVSHHLGDEDREDAHPASLVHSDLVADVDYELLRNLVATATVALPDVHRELIALRYGEGVYDEAGKWDVMPLPQVGRRLGMGRGKATQLYAEACMLLREHLAVLS